MAQCSVHPYSRGLPAARLRICEIENFQVQVSATSGTAIEVAVGIEIPLYETR